MVQGYKSTSPKVSTHSDRNSDSKRSGYQSMQQTHDKPRDLHQSNKDQSTSKYGAWGPVFKNREHFVSLHHC